MTAPWKIYLSPPEVGPIERELLLNAFDSNWIAPAGPDLDAFEAELAAITGASAVAALSSGTAGLHLALLAVGVQAGDDVLVSSLTFAASAFAAIYIRARPCFVDSEAASWHIDPDLLEQELAERARSGRLPGAVVSVDLYGSVADGERLMAICATYDVPLIEDAAEAIGATRNGTPAGRFGRVAVLSFNGNKMVTTSGGGALVSDDPAVVARARHLATQARSPAPWYEHDEVGFNYRLSNLSAAVGRGQLRTLPDRIAGRRQVRETYERRLGAVPGFTFQQIPDGVEPNHWLTTVRVDPDMTGMTPTEVLAALHERRIEARHGFKPMHLQPVFAEASVVGGDVAADLFATTVSLPSGSRLTEDEVGEICDVILSCRR
ncbi:MAG: aminotransferase class I/II-fold pyridoxal phosphate-dependent enzyme [Ilumatobacteraceae bacterium]